MIKWHMNLKEGILEENPIIWRLEEKPPLLDARQDIVDSEVPKVGKEVAVEAIKEWGQPKSMKLIKRP